MGTDIFLLAFFNREACTLAFGPKTVRSKNSRPVLADNVDSQKIWMCSSFTKTMAFGSREETFCCACGVGREILL